MVALRVKSKMKTSISPALPVVALAISLSACAPQREFVQFSDAGTFHPGPAQGGGDRSAPQGEYDSYELIDHGAPNQGIAPMYQGNQQGYQQGYQPQPRGHGGGGYPAVVKPTTNMATPEMSSFRTLGERKK